MGTRVLGKGWCWLWVRIARPVAGFHAYNSRSCVTVACWSHTVEPVAHHVPVVTTELGESGCSQVFINSFMNWADAAGVSYLGWTWNLSGCTARSYRVMERAADTIRRGAARPPD